MAEKLPADIRQILPLFSQLSAIFLFSFVYWAIMNSKWLGGGWFSAIDGP